MDGEKRREVWSYIILVKLTAKSKYSTVGKQRSRKIVRLNEKGLKKKREYFKKISEEELKRRRRGGGGVDGEFISLLP